ncbi:metallophosphoesterase [Nonomuraea thailandensis]
MKVHVVSDVHGRADALAGAADGADALICLGDLILFVDYDDHAQGIFADLFGAENARRFIELRTAKRFDEARAMSARLWATLDGDPREHIERNVRAQYDALFAAMPTPAFLTYGNVDLPRLWADYLRPGHQVLDGQVAEIGGLRFGFVGGGLKTPTAPRTRSPTRSTPPRSRPSARWTCCAATSRPRCPSCCTTWWPGGSSAAARRRWRRSGAPSRATPCSATCTTLRARARVGRTECVNVGHFRGRACRTSSNGDLTGTVQRSAAVGGLCTTVVACLIAPLRASPSAPRRPT